MRTALVIAAILSLLSPGCVEKAPERPVPPDPVREPTEPLGCVIRANPTCEVGGVPSITVALINQTDADIYLVGSLDASDCKWRRPFCYFEVTGPDGRGAAESGGRCLHRNPLREEDFVKVRPGGTFDPYQTIDEYGFAGAYQQLNPGTFGTAGEYRIRFVYSTKSDNIGEWSGDSTDEKLVRLLRQVPKVEVRSNEIKVTIVERGK